MAAGYSTTQPDKGPATISQHETFEAMCEAQQPERRFYPRASVLAELRQTIFVELGSTGGLLLDISAGGISVQAAHAIKKGATLGVRFLLPFSQYLVQAPCEVAWADDDHAGLKFAPLSDVQQCELGLWLEAYGTGSIAPSAIAVEAPLPDALQEVAKYYESCAPNSPDWASAVVEPSLTGEMDSGAVEPSLAGRIEPEAVLPWQEAIERNLARMVEEVPSPTETDGATLALPDNQEVACETPTVDPPLADRRAHRRSLIGVPMLARWRDDREHEVKINSRDISDGGIFFHTSSDIAIGTEVDVTFTLPSDPAVVAGNKRIHVQGTVIRAEREADKNGYALRATTSELLGVEATVAQARQAVRGVGANDPFSDGTSRARRTRLLFRVCGMVALIALAGLAGLGIYITQNEGGLANPAAAILEMVKSILSTPENAPPPAVLQSRVERKRRVSRTGGAEATGKKAESIPAEHEAVERNRYSSAAQVRSTVESTVQPRAAPFNNNNVRTLDFQKGRHVSPLGYIGDLPKPPTKWLAAGSFASTEAPTGAATATPNSAVVVLRVVVDSDGSVQDVRRTSGSVELAPSAIAAIRHWKFQSTPGGIPRQVYVTVNFTISAE